LEPEATWALGALCPAPVARSGVAERGPALVAQRARVDGAAPAGRASAAERRALAAQAPAVGSARGAQALAEQQVLPARRTAALQPQAVPAPAVDLAQGAPELAEQQVVALAAKRPVAPPIPGQAERPSSRLAAPAPRNRVTLP
jgi:hypothetical protein